MEDSEKMTALKKAYAEIILNTAKEAAARIMVSERKVHQSHHDLSSTKEEALRLLLRLKQTMDFKINEAEKKSLNQQRRIEELEAQLQEAEDIVGNLRAELNEAHMKLEEMAKNQMHSGSNTMENGHRGENNSSEEYGYGGDPDVPSIITKSKEPELYRNGCTQRIRACHGNSLNDHFSLSDELGDVKNEKTTREDKKGESVCIIGNKPVNIKEVKNVDKISSKCQAFKSFHKKRKRAARHRTRTRLAGPPNVLEASDNEEKGAKSNLPSTSPSIAINEDREVASSLVLIRKQSGSGDRLDVQTSNLDLEMKNTSSVNMDDKPLGDTSDGLPSPSPKDKVLKYTFQRKRKKEALSSNGCSLENPLKRKSGKKQNGCLEPSKSSEVAESSRDSRRMAQVARQLISLSEKKWWK